MLADIDKDIAQHERDTAEALIEKELRTTNRTGPHASLPPAEPPHFSETFLKELERIAAGQKIKGGDMRCRTNQLPTPM
jgi:Breast carcinoma amplified sequence 2 (BCAS2)